MIKIDIFEEPIEDEDDYDYELSANITLPEEATATQCIYAFIRALKVSGYHEASIERAILELAEDIENGDIKE